jgi:hypothetical protein
MLPQGSPAGQTEHISFEPGRSHFCLESPLPASHGSGAQSPLNFSM